MGPTGRPAIFPSRASDQGLMPSLCACPPLLGQPEPPAKMAGFGTDGNLRDCREGRLTKRRDLPKYGLATPMAREASSVYAASE
jgi:hypothetical protein